MSVSIWWENFANEANKSMVEKLREESKSIIQETLSKIYNQEESKMKVCYKEFTGELVRLERRTKTMKEISYINGEIKFDVPSYSYDIDIYDVEKECKISFTDVNLSDIKFIGGNTTF